LFVQLEKREKKSLHSILELQFDAVFKYQISEKKNQLGCVQKLLKSTNLRNDTLDQVTPSSHLPHTFVTPSSHNTISLCIASHKTTYLTMSHLCLTRQRKSL